MTGAAIYELPFGKGRHFMNNTNKIIDGVLGGWGVGGARKRPEGVQNTEGHCVVSGVGRFSV